MSGTCRTATRPPWHDVSRVAGRFTPPGRRARGSVSDVPVCERLERLSLRTTRSGGLCRLERSKDSAPLNGLLERWALQCLVPQTPYAVESGARFQEARDQDENRCWQPTLKTDTRSACCHSSSGAARTAARLRPVLAQVSIEIQAQLLRVGHTPAGF